MARRSEHTQEKLKEMAIDAGYQMLEERGLRDFSARAVAAKMGYTVGTIYHLFGTLDNFILHVNARTMDEWYADTIEGVPKRGDQIVRYLAQSYFKYAREHYNRWSALFEHRMQNDAPVPEWYQPKMLRMFELVEDAVLPHMGNDKKKAQRLARVLWASVHGICTLSLSGKLEQVQADPAEKMIDDLMGFVTASGKK